MTGATAKTTIKIGASHRERAAARLPLQPMFVSGGLHGHEAAAHHRMIGATELRAEKMISSGACGREPRSEEHTSELQSLMRISYAVFCLKKKKTKNQRLRNVHRQ